MPNTRPTFSLALFSGLALSLAALGFASPALGQNALGDGTALDRNLQVGSGGKNTRVRDVEAQARYNNAVVTGNVPFGRGLRSGRGAFGEVNYGSSSLFRFELDSYASALAGRGVSATDSLRYQFALATGQYVPEVLGATGAIYRPGVSASTALPASTALRATSDYLAAQALRPSVAGYRTGRDGTIFSATASPLLGVGWIKMQDPARRTDRQLDTLAQPNLGAPSLSTLPTTGNVPKDTIPGMPEGYQPKNRLGSAVFSGLEPAAAGMATPLQASSARLNSRVNDESGRIVTRSTEHERLVRAIETAYKPYDPTAKTTDPDTAETTDDTEAKPSDPNAPRDTLGKPIPSWEREINDLRERLRKRGITPSTPDNPDEPTDQPAEPGQQGRPSPNDPKTDPKQDTKANPSLVYQAKALGLDVKTVQALRDAGVRLDKLTADGVSQNPSYQRHMTAGQELLADGRYFDAEDRFLRALAASPGDPMAAVGRMHAQLGGGLYLSAALNLRQLFVENPEMVAAKYAGALLPSAERTARIADQLRTEIANDDSALGRDAALLLAYLGHVTGDAAMAAEGLKTLEERTGEDETADQTLIMLLKSVWEKTPEK